MALSLIILTSVLFNTGVVFSTMAPTKELNDGNKMPILALGTGRGTANGAPATEVRAAVFWAIEAGYRHIDTASYYGDEVEVGQGIADAIARGLVAREEMFVTTKLWNNRHAKDQVVPELKKSLRNLVMDYVDLYLIHTPMAIKDDNTFEDIDYLLTWQGMEQAKDLGLTRSIGVSNFNASQIDRLYPNARIKPAVNQIEVNPSLTQERLVDHCHKLGIAVMAYSPFGFLVSRRRQEVPPPSQDDPALVKISQNYRKTPSQIVLRYLVQRGLIPIPKSTNRERIAQNIQIFDFQLSNDEMSTISAFNRNIRVIDMKAWNNHPYYPFGIE